MAENILWMAPSFLWEEALKDTTRERLGQPAMFRFDNDSFMEELASRLEKDPSSLKDLTARHETWIKKSSGWLSENESKKEEPILKLYQPTHGYFYIVAAMLICRIPGFPDRKIDISNDEKASFVMRRLVPSDNKKPIDINNPVTYTEYGIIEGKGWVKVSAKSIVEDEERLALFSLYFMQDNTKRRLLAGLIPVSRKEGYQEEPEFRFETFSDEDKKMDALAIDDPALREFKTLIITAFENLIKYCEKTTPVMEVANAEVAREVLANIALDMAGYFHKYMSRVLDDQWTGPINEQKTLYEELKVSFYQAYTWKDILKKNNQEINDILKNMKISDITNAVSVFKKIDKVDQVAKFDSFCEIIRNALPPQKDVRLLQFEKYTAKPFAALFTELSGNAGRSEEGVRQSFLFVLLDLAGFLSEQLVSIWTAIINNTETGIDERGKNVVNMFRNTIFYGEFRWDDALREIWDKRSGSITGKAKGPIISGASSKNIHDALANLNLVDDNYSTSRIYSVIREALLSIQPPSKPPSPLNTDKTAGAVFLIRFVYDRPKCRNISESFVSEPTKRFQLANFYDPDAPVRPVRITLPFDTSIKGFKKYPRNVCFIIGDQLRTQMETIKEATFQNIGDVWPKIPAFNQGMVCSFSIPIIAVCAWMLLMIVVILLNFIFWWLPYFRRCWMLIKPEMVSGDVGCRLNRR